MSELLDFKAKVDFTEAERDVANFERMLARVGVAPASSANFTQANTAMTQAIRSSMLETERLRQENLELQNQWQRGAITLNELTARQRANTIARQQETAAARAARTAQVAVNGSYREAQQRLRELGDRIRNVEGGFNGLGRVQRERIAEYRRLNDSLQEFDRRMGNNQRNVGNYSSAISGVKGQLTGLVATYVSAAAAIGLVTSAFSQSLKSSAVRTSLEFTFGSVDLADAKLEQLLDTANRLGVNYNALTSSYKSFTGAVVASNFDFQQGERIFNAVAGASSKLKLSAEDTEGALRALQQMISKGNVQAEELRGQLGERIPGAFSIAARAIGVTETQLNKMLQKGEVLAADLLPKLATELEKTFGLESTAAIEGLNAETERFFNLFSGAVAESSNINAFFTTVIKGFNEIAGTIFKIVNSDSWQEFFIRLIKGSESAEAVKNIQISADQTAKAIKQVISLNENNSVKDRTMAYEGLSLAHQKATKSLEALNKKIKDGGVEDKGGLDGKRLKNDIALLESKMRSEKEILDKLKKPSGKPEESASEKAARLAREREAERELNAQRTLQKKITDLKNEASRKTLTKDEEEVQAVRDKFAKIAEEIKVFNANPKNKLKVDGSGLEPAMKAQIVSIEYKQDTDKLKDSLEVQKGLYEQYESYRTELGKKAADERFGEQIKYADRLQNEYDKVLTQGSKTGFTGAMTERMKILEKEIKAEGVVESKRQDELIKSLRSFEKERSAMEEQYKRDRVDVLTRGGGASELAELDKQNAKKLQALGDAHLKELDAFKDLYAGIDRLSDGNARKVIGNAEDALKGLKAKGVVISKELEAELRRLFSDSKDAVNERLPDRIIALANQIDNVASAVSGVDEAFSKVLGTVGNVLGQVGNIKKGMLDLSKAQAKGDTLGSLTAGLGIFGAGISIFSSIFKLFDRSQQREEQASYARDLQNKQTEALNKALERQVSLLNDAYGTERITKYNAAILQASENQAKYQSQLATRYSLTGDKRTDDIISQINNGDQNSSTVKNTIRAMQNLLNTLKLPTEIDALQRLLDEGKLDSNTAAIVSNLISANEEASKLANNLRAERVGAGLDTIVDEFMTNLESGVGGIEDVLTKAIRRGLLNSLKGDITDKFLQDYYSMLDKALTDGNISADEDALLREQLKKADEYGKARLDYINKAAPETAVGAVADTLKGRIESIRSDQADKLVGVFTGVQVATIKTNGLVAQSNDWLGKIYAEASLNLSSIQANTLRTANNTDSIPAMKDAIVSMNKKMDDNAKALGGSGRI